MGVGSFVVVFGARVDQYVHRTSWYCAGAGVACSSLDSFALVSIVLAFALASVVPLHRASGRAGVCRATVRVVVRAAICCAAIRAGVRRIGICNAAIRAAIRAAICCAALLFMLASIVLALSLALMQPSVVLAFVLVTVTCWHLHWHPSCWRSRWHPSCWQSRW